MWKNGILLVVRSLKFREKEIVGTFGTFGRQWFAVLRATRPMAPDPAYVAWLDIYLHYFK